MVSTFLIAFFVIKFASSEARKVDAEISKENYSMTYWWKHGKDPFENSIYLIDDENKCS